MLLSTNLKEIKQKEYFPFFADLFTKSGALYYFLNELEFTEKSYQVPWKCQLQPNQLMNTTDHVAGILRVCSPVL